MRSPSIAIAWQVWSRHRMGFVISAASVAVAIVAYPPILPRLDRQAGLVASSIPLAIAFAYLVNILIFADEAGSLTTGYPRRMFTLPLRSSSLALWPMLLSTGIMGLLWVITSVLVYGRSGFDVPILLPAVAIALITAWFQVLCWSPLPKLVIPYLAVLGIWGLVGVPFMLLVRGSVSQTTLILLGLAALPLLYLMACTAISRDRRGERWDLGVDHLIRAFQAIRGRYLYRLRSFRSSADAQLWYEETCQSGVYLGLMTFQNSIVFLFALFTRKENLFAIHLAIGILAATPLLSAASQGGTLGRWSPIWIRRSNMLRFLAVRPMTSGELIRAKYRLAWRMLWKSLAISISLAIALVVLRRDARPEVAIVETARLLLPGWRWVVALGLGIPWLIVYQWKLLTDHLVPAFTNRPWIMDGSTYLGLAGLLGAISMSIWSFRHPWIIPFLVTGGAWLAVVVTAIKIAVAVVAMRSSVDRGLLARQEAAWFAAGWVLAAAMTVTLGALFLPAQGLPAPRLLLLAVPLFLLPTARFGVAPLVLEWSRHR